MADAEVIRGDQPIRITRDEHGVPHVHARTEPDLYRGLGYAHARDRGLQVLVGRILGQGRLCELLSDNEESLAVDRAFRRLGFFVGAADEADKLAAHERANVDAYCAGIDAGLARGVPWELRLLGFKDAEPWAMRDSVMLSRLMGHFGLSQSQEVMERFVVELVQAGVGRLMLDALFPGRLEGLDEALLRRVDIGEPILPEHVRRNLAAFGPGGTAGSGGSNNWVVAGSKTRSGKPLLANDPHLEVNRLPCVWQEVVFEGGARGAGWYAMGATVPGLPAIIIGRTPSVAWGVTYAYMDGSDSWLEDVRGGRYRRGAGKKATWHAFDLRRETILRKKNDAVHLVLQENEHGLVQGDASVDGLHLTTRWAPARGTGARSFAAFQHLLAATSAREALNELGRVETAWNWVACDVDGHIGHQMSGLAPIRPKHMTGFVPLAGWHPQNDWQGFHDPADLPRCFDPDEGYFTTANNDLTRYAKHRVQNLTMGDYRLHAIMDRLRDRDDWTVEATRRLQLDNRSQQALRFLPILRPLLPMTKQADILRRWRGHYAPGSQGPWLFERFYRKLVEQVMGKHFGTATARYMRDDTGLVAGFHGLIDDALVDPDNPWYGDASRDAVWRHILADVCRGRVGTLRKDWTFHMTHMLLGRKPGMSVGPLRLAGGRATILQFQAFRVAGRRTTFAPTYRFVADMAQEGAHTIVAGGPTDRPFTKGYSSEVKDWVAGRLKRLVPDDGASP